jgi:hypothetical protein
MNRTVALAAAAALGITGALVAFAPSALGPGSAAPDAARSAWTEVQWPFPKDPWGRGRAFRCGPADCAAEVNLYLRAKLGFCNCVTGIADDADLDGMGDVALVGGAAAPLGDGRPVAIGWMKGRAPAPMRALAANGTRRCCPSPSTTAATWSSPRSSCRVRGWKRSSRTSSRS